MPNRTDVYSGPTMDTLLEALAIFARSGAQDYGVGNDDPGGAYFFVPIHARYIKLNDRKTLSHLGWEYDPATRAWKIR